MLNFLLLFKKIICKGGRIYLVTVGWQDFRPFQLEILEMVVEYKKILPKLSLGCFSVFRTYVQLSVARRPKTEKSFHYRERIFLCRGGRIRTCGPLLPKQVR